jgi:hypothetical protein
MRASASGVRWVKTWRGDSSAPAARASATSRSVAMLSPPSATKSSSSPTFPTPSAAANAAQSAAWTSVSGGR